MKKSTIWLLTIVMAITFGALLYFQIMYLENMVKMREAQFSENVMRSLYATAGYLEREETLHFLEEDVNIIESSLYDSYAGSGAISYSVESPDGTITNYGLPTANGHKTNGTRAGFPSPIEDISSRYKSMQEVIRSQYLYQRGLLNEVILNILRESGNRPITERADSATVRKYLTMELANNGLNEPFVFAITDDKNNIVYQTEGYDPALEKGVYTQALFQNSGAKFYLIIEFPTKNSYIFSSVWFLIPTLSFTVILLIIFLYTIILAFRQKKLTEMKSDFINNMTHELKTPISTISLAGQMLSDDSVRKSPTSLKHLSQVITEESKRPQTDDIATSSGQGASALCLRQYRRSTEIHNSERRFDNIQRGQHLQDQSREIRRGIELRPYRRQSGRNGRRDAIHQCHLQPFGQCGEIHA